MNARKLKIVVAHPLTTLVVITTIWIISRKLSTGTPAQGDQYGPGFFGDFVAFNVQAAGYAASEALGLPVDTSWATVLTATVINLALAITVEWGVQRVARGVRESR